VKLHLKLRHLVEIAVAQGKIRISHFCYFAPWWTCLAVKSFVMDVTEIVSEKTRRETNTTFAVLGIASTLILIRNVTSASDSLLGPAPRRTHEKARASAHTGHNFVFRNTKCRYSLLRQLLQRATPPCLWGQGKLEVERVGGRRNCLGVGARSRPTLPHPIPNAAGLSCPRGSLSQGVAPSFSHGVLSSIFVKLQ
jgi:hypothetical protein